MVDELVKYWIQYLNLRKSNLMIYGFRLPKMSVYLSNKWHYGSNWSSKLLIIQKLHSIIIIIYLKYKIEKPNISF